MTKKSFKIKGNLAEALEDTVTSAKNNAGELHVEIIPLRKVSLDPDNPRDLALTFQDVSEELTTSDQLYERKVTEKKSLDSLSKSIVDQGVINPIVVYKHNDQYRLIAGERRTLASILAKKEDVPARVLTSKPDQLKLSLIQWIENIEREDLTLWERIRNLEKILSSYAAKKQIDPSRISPTELSQIIGCSLQQGVNYRHALNGSKELNEHIQRGSINSIEKAALISKSPVKDQAVLIRACLDGLTLSQLKRFAKEIGEKKPQRSQKKPSTKINLGTTSSLKVAKKILHTFLEHQDYRHLQSKIGNISDSNESITTAFKQLLKLLEKE